MLEVQCAAKFKPQYFSREMSPLRQQEHALFTVGLAGLGTFATFPPGLRLAFDETLTLTANGRLLLTMPWNTFLKCARRSGKTVSPKPPKRQSIANS